MNDPFRNYDAWLEAPIQRQYAEADRWLEEFETWCGEALGVEADDNNPELIAKFEAYIDEQNRLEAENEAKWFAEEEAYFEAIGGRCPATGSYHIWTNDTGPLPLWHHGDTVHCDECGQSPSPQQIAIWESRRES